MDFAMSGLDHAPLCKFLEKLMQNPSKRAVEELYTFLEHKNLPITSNGNFIAYKGLLPDFYSITSGRAKLVKGKVKDGKIYNGIGEEIEMQRRDVCDDKEIGCSYGLHAGSLDYATSFARGKVVIVEINPKDVVSIPVDCNFKKLRTCAYKVTGEYTAPLTQPLYESKWEDDLGDDPSDSEPELYFELDSSWIDYVEWYSDGLLYINAGDRVLVYENVPYGVADGFANAESAGVYYNDAIKGQYDQVN
jgi:hypothetical protein